MFEGIALLAVSFAWGQTIVAPQQRPEKTSFAIVTDQVTWEKCRPEIENYRAVLEQEQLPAYIMEKSGTNKGVVDASLPGEPFGRCCIYR